MKTQSASPAPLQDATPANAAPRPLPYGLHCIEDDDVAAVAEAVRGELLASGPTVARFERAFADKVGAADAVACSSGTAALQIALAALDLQEGDVCIVPAITFLATATAARLCGAEVVFADVDPFTGLMTVDTLREALAKSQRVRAVVPVHLGGRLCDIPALEAVAHEAGAELIEDCCHAVGGLNEAGRPVGACDNAFAATFSFHPVKMITSGEGGMVTTADAKRGEVLRRLRNHGVTRDKDLMSDPMSFDQDGVPNPWSYEQLDLGFNYRMSEMQGALGMSQLGKLDRFVDRRQMLTDRYVALLHPLQDLVQPVLAPEAQRPGLHLLSVSIDFEAAGIDRARLMRALAAEGVGTQVHYIPVYRQPYFTGRYGQMRLEGAEAYYASTLSLPLFPLMSGTDVDRVVLTLSRLLGRA
jgi:UDP-4-amino-4,6-dideoxy-N-acetyl-beta-L-altrosamine transaminase